MVAKLCPKLSPEEKVNLAVEMTDICVRICMAGIRSQHPELEEKAIMEKVRKRILSVKPVKHKG